MKTYTNTSTLIESQLLATKFFVPVASGRLVSRPRLTGLLDKSLRYSLTLISAPAGFGKTTLLAAWRQSLPASYPKFAWISLDEEDNQPQLFWTYVLTALNRQQPESFTSLLTQQQSAQALPIKYILRALINELTETKDQFVLILDDYHTITEQQIHTSLSYLVEHLPSQLHIILSTRVDPPLPLIQLRARHQVLEVRTDQLRCTAEETEALFKDVVGIQLPDEMIKHVTTRTEGWLVGLQLLGLSLPEQADPATLLEEISGDQSYILDFLTQEVLQRQPQEVQTFLLSTSILERLSGSLCDAVTQQNGSHQMLQRLEQANLFLSSLDSKRQWYRYHALFAEALHYRLEQIYADLVPILHHRASLWYAQHNQITQAILHAFHAHQWEWAADLIERHPLFTFAWGASEHELVLLREWLKCLPVEVMGSRPRLCLICTQMVWLLAPPPMLQAWFDAAQATLTTLLMKQTNDNDSQATLSPEAKLETENLLGEVIASRAYVQSYYENGEAALSLCQQALPLLSADNNSPRVLMAWAHLHVYYYSLNDAEVAIQSGLQAISLAQAAGNIGMTHAAMSMAAAHMKEAGRLHEAQQLIEQIIQMGTKLGGPVLPERGWPTIFKAELLREWNDFDTARSLIEQGIELCEQSKTIASLPYKILGYAVLLRISLSRGELDTAQAALQEFERIGRNMNQPSYIYLHSFFTTVDQVRFWLANGELDYATRWAEELDIGERCGNPFQIEREEVARIRILLANNQPTLALQRSEPILQRVTAGQRWNHVIEIRVLQALAYQMQQEEKQALKAISEAVRLAEPEGYIRTFADEGTPIVALLSKLREQQSKSGPTPYLDTVLAAFPPQSKVLPEALSKREIEVLLLLAHGASNQDIAKKLVITVDTVKRHVSHIFAKLGAQNRMQVLRQAQAQGLLDEKD